MNTPKLRFALAFVTGGLSVLLPGRVAAQMLTDLYRITDGVSRNHMEYHRLEVPKGGERILADLKGPGKVTYFYITEDYTSVAFWYQEEPHQAFTLPPFAERTAPSKAGDKK
jgi:hypothetical protein